MRRLRQSGIAGRVLLGVSLLAVCRVAVAQQARAEYPYLRYARTHVRFGICDGRVAVAALKTSSFVPPPTKTPDRTEQVAVQYDYRAGSATFRYQLETPDQTFAVAAGTDGQVSAHQQPKSGGRIVPSEFTQPPSGPLTLSFGSGDKKETFTAPTIWHLLLAHRGACNQYLMPFLRILRPDWQLVEQADQIEAELLRAARLGKLPDRSRWAEWVAQLGDDQYAKREAADRQLRAIGQPVAAYLKGLRRDKLDAEQQYRIHRIIQALTDLRGDESAEQITSAMLGDPTVWLILLERESPGARRLATEHLRRLLEGPIDFDPDADLATRRRQVELLRERIGDGGR